MVHDGGIIEDTDLSDGSEGLLARYRYLAVIGYRAHGHLSGQYSNSFHINLGQCFFSTVSIHSGKPESKSIEHSAIATSDSLHGLT